MSTLELKEKIHHFIDEADDKILEAIYVLLESKREEKIDLSIEQYNKELDDALIRVKSGSFYTQEEVEKCVLSV